MSIMRKGRTLAAIFFLFGIMLNYPIIQLFSGKGQWAGIPKSYLGILGLWLAMIVIFFLVVERNPKKPS